MYYITLTYHVLFPSQPFLYAVSSFLKFALSNQPFCIHLHSTMAISSLPPRKDQPSQKRKISKAATSSSTTTFQSRLAAIEHSLSTSSDLNPLFDLVQLLKRQTAEQPNEADVLTAQRGMKFLVRSLQVLLKDQRIPLTQVNDSGLAEGSFREQEGQTEADKAVADWLRQRWNESIELLCTLLANEVSSVRVSNICSLLLSYPSI